MKRHLFTGLAILLPVAMTVWIVGFVVSFLTQPFLGITEDILSTIGIKDASFPFLQSQQVLKIISQLLILIFLSGTIITIGAVTRYFFFRYIIKLGDSVLHKIPVISSVYKTSQELIQTIFTSDNKAFKQVVLVPFPNPESMSIGLLTGDQIMGERIPVFVPTTPNPTSGYLVMYKADEVIPIEMSVETALRYVISCGVLIDPNNLANGFKPISATMHTVKTGEHSIKEISE